MVTLDIPVDQDSTTRVTVSIGTCSAPARGLAGAHELLATAQTALAAARDRGGNRVECEELLVPASEDS